jgi:hypothetical protein
MIQAPHDMPLMALTDDEMSILRSLAAPLELGRRDAFLRAVAQALAHESVRGPGVVHRVGREEQRRFFDPPQMSDRGFGGAHSRSPKQGFGWLSRATR